MGKAGQTEGLSLYGATSRFPSSFLLARIESHQHPLQQRSLGKCVNFRYPLDYIRSAWKPDKAWLLTRLFAEKTGMGV
jgi:hypothetical protein